MTLSFVDAPAADGPKLAEFLRERGLYGLLSENHQRRARDWGRGAFADFYVVDRVMCGLGLHVSELPPDIWVGEIRRPRVEAEPRGLRLVQQERMCEGCGDAIPLRQPGGRLKTVEEYEIAKFCSNTCRFEAQQGSSGRWLREAA